MRITLRISLTLAAMFIMGASRPNCSKQSHCQSDADCGAGQVCELEGPNCGPDKICVAGCHENSDCGAGEICQELQCLTCPCPGECRPAQNIGQEGDPCGENTGVECAQGLYCATGQATDNQGDPEGTCTAMGQCGNVFDCQNPANQWDHIACVGYTTCEAGSCNWTCGQEPTCEDDQDCPDGTVCEPVTGCLDEKTCVAGCHSHSDCQENHHCMQPHCLTCPCPGSCIDNPKVAQKGESCGPDIHTSCDVGLYCAFGLVTCGTPPVVGMCRGMGECGNTWDCEDSENEWNHIDCDGFAMCTDERCDYVCDTEPKCENDTDCPAGEICEPMGPACNTEKTCMVGCHQDSDCEQGQTCTTPMCFACPCPGTCG